MPIDDKVLQEVYRTDCDDMYFRISNLHRKPEEWEDFDELLSSLDPSRLNEEQILAILESTDYACLRDSRRSFYQKVGQELERNPSFLRDREYYASLKGSEEMVETGESFRKYLESYR
jgi:hypothetical protein